MSFILDALKKSENERQRHVGPSLADVQIRRHQSDRPWWAVAVAGLLVINLGVLLVVLLGRNDDASPAVSLPASEAPSARAQQSHQPAPAPGASTRAPGANTPSPAVRSLADEADGIDTGAIEGSAFNPDLAAASTVPEGPPLVRSIDAPAVAPASRPMFESRAAENEMLPTHSDLTASGTALPELHLDIHVHSGNPAERFVFVNMRKYVEGQALTEGPTVERITADGVVLNQRGLRFLLPRQ